MPAHMAGRAGEPQFMGQRLRATGEWLGDSFGETPGLFRERRMTANAPLVFVDRVRRHIEQLAEDPRPHRSGV
ncbi:MAG: hypothetical protein A3F77_04155 [Betaproteobacteria bacterium RIFCSPLOWO2_12_FULL_67_28]|nr:MAG: hypothetical protein A3F77_04155 [Betaproteobacteria bacterium RIFCSPLOWO2_12_FULL_67_28]